MADNQPTRSTRLPETLDDQYTEYRDDKGMTNSEALRSLVRAGLEAKKQEEESSGSLLSFRQRGGVSERVAGGVMAAALAAIVANATLGPTAALAVGVAALGAGAYLATVVGIRLVRSRGDSGDAELSADA
jgi:hypothetical protein